MPGLVQHLAELPTHQTGLVAALLALKPPLSWHKAGPPERATILILAALAAMDLAIWRFGGGSTLLHLGADALALSWMLPVALRANRFYPAAICAVLLIAGLVQLFHLLGLARDDRTVSVLVNVLHAVSVLIFLGGALVHRQILAGGNDRPPWRNRLSHG